MHKEDRRYVDPSSDDATAINTTISQDQNGLREALVWYDEDYLHFADHISTPERTENEVEFIWRALGLQPGARVLDLACGYGRIAIALAARGATVTAVDAVPLLIDRARADAARTSVQVDFRLGDIRDISRLGTFDAVLLWFYSFGYHADDDNRRILRCVADALRPGGRLLLDQYNTASLGRAGDAYTVLDLGHSLLLQRPVRDLQEGRWGAERVAIRDGAIRRSRFMCRCYSPPEMRTMLQNEGFEPPTFWGDGFQPLSLESTKQIVLAVRRMGGEAKPP